MVGASEVVAAGQGVGVGVAEDPLAVGEGPLVQRDGLVQPPGLLVGKSEIVTGSQGVGVGLAEDPLAVGEGPLAVGRGPLVQRDGLSQPPGLREWSKSVQFFRLAWSLDSTRRWRRSRRNEMGTGLSAEVTTPARNSRKRQRRSSYGS